jgi:hypothetical protein
MCIIEDYFLKGFSDLCIKDTLSNDIIKEVAILPLEVFQVLGNDAMFVVTKLIK